MVCWPIILQSTFYDAIEIQKYFILLLSIILTNVG